MKRTYNRWTSAELKRLIKFYPTMPRLWLLQEFEPRTINDIYMAAQKLKLRRRRDWQVVARKYTPMVFAPGAAL